MTKSLEERPVFIVCFVSSPSLLPEPSRCDEPSHPHHQLHQAFPSPRTLPNLPGPHRLCLQITSLKKSSPTYVVLSRVFAKAVRKVTERRCDFREALAGPLDISVAPRCAGTYGLVCSAASPSATLTACSQPHSPRKERADMADTLLCVKQV